MVDPADDAAQEVHSLSHMPFCRRRKLTFTRKLCQLLRASRLKTILFFSINAATAGSEYCVDACSILSPGLQACQYTFWSDREARCQQCGRRCESVWSLVVMVAIDRRELPQSKLSTDCLDGVIIITASALCRMADGLLRCTYLWVCMAASMCSGVLRDSVSALVHDLFRLRCEMTGVWPTLRFSQEHGLSW